MTVAFDLSHDEMAVALSYIGIGGAATAPVVPPPVVSTARALPAATEKADTPKPSAVPKKDDDDVRLY